MQARSQQPYNLKRLDGMVESAQVARSPTSSRYFAEALTERRLTRRIKLREDDLDDPIDFRKVQDVAWIYRHTSIERQEPGRGPVYPPAPRPGAPPAKVVVTPAGVTF
jgi:hypothetical protein